MYIKVNYINFKLVQINLVCVINFQCVILSKRKLVISLMFENPRIELIQSKIVQSMYNIITHYLLYIRPLFLCLNLGEQVRKCNLLYLMVDIK